MRSKINVENALLKKELQDKLEMIREKEAALPDMIAEVVSTKPYREKVRHFMVVLEKYIAGLDEKLVEDGELEKPHLQEDHNPCGEMYTTGSAEFAECQWLREQLNEYGVVVLGSISVDQLRTLYVAVKTTAFRLLHLVIVNCGVSSYADSSKDAQTVFNTIFGPVEFAFTGGAGFAETGSTRNERGAFPISLTAETFADDTSAIIGNIIHEIGHVFHNVLGSDDDGQMTILPTEAAGQSITIRTH